MAKTDRPLEILVVTNTIHPYQRHNIPVLSLPAGTTYHFRYEASYFDMSPNEIVGLTGKSGLLVLRDFVRGTFIPLRTFRVFRVDPAGEFVFLELEFLSFVRYESVKRIIEVSEDDSLEKKARAVERDQISQKEREKYSDVISSVLLNRRIENKAGEAINRLIIPSGPTMWESIPVDDRKNKPISISCWFRIATLLGGIESYRKAGFYFIAAISDLTSGKEVGMFQTKWRRGLKLYANRSYVVQIFQVMGNGQPPAPAFQLKLEYLEEHILPLRDSTLVDGAYDKLEFYFSATPQEGRRSQSVLVVESDQALPDPRGGATSVSIPESTIILLIKWTKWHFVQRRVLPVPIFALAVLLWFYADRLSAYGVKTEYLQLIALFLMALAVQNWTVFTGAFKTPSGPKG